MSRRYLGGTFDIHGGGIDLHFPHHENEQAQSHGAGWDFVRHWAHNVWVTIKDEKMSESLGSPLVVAELLRHYDAAVLRLALGTVHHRSTVEFSEETLVDVAALQERLSGAILRAYEFCDGRDANPVDAPAEQVRAQALPAEFTAIMDEDLNLAGVMAVIHATLRTLNVALTQAAPSGGQGADDALRASVTGLALNLRFQLDVLSLDPLSEPWCTRVLDGAGSSQGGAAMEALDRLIHHDLEERVQARVAKNWARADALRDKLTGTGVVVEGSPSGAC